MANFNYQQFLAQVRKDPEFAGKTAEEQEGEAKKRLELQKTEGKQPEVKEEVKGQDAMIPVSAILEFLGKDKGSDETKELLKQLIEQQKISNIPEGLRKRVSSIKEEDIDKGDYMKEPKVFYAYNFYYAIYGDRRLGRDVSTPYDTPIQFRLLKTKRVSDGTLCVCSTLIYSKKEYEWLQNHSLFNLFFFEQLADEDNVDITLVNKMSEISGMFTSMNQRQIVERAQQMGLPISQDIMKVRNSMIRKMAEDEITFVRRRNQNVAKQMHESLSPEIAEESEKTGYLTGKKQ